MFKITDELIILRRNTQNFIISLVNKHPGRFPVLSAVNSALLGYRLQMLNDAVRTLKGKEKSSIAKSPPEDNRIWSIINYQPATDNGVRDGRSNWLVAPPRPHGQYPLSAFMHSINQCSLCRESTLQREWASAAHSPLSLWMQVCLRHNRTSMR